MFTSTTVNYVYSDPFELLETKTFASLVISVNIYRPLTDEVYLQRPHSKGTHAVWSQKGFQKLPRWTMTLP